MGSRVKAIGPLRVHTFNRSHNNNDFVGDGCRRLRQIVISELHKTFCVYSSTYDAQKNQGSIVINYQILFIVLQSLYFALLWLNVYKAAFF